jgi:hypothetical protein
MIGKKVPFVSTEPPGFQEIRLISGKCALKASRLPTETFLSIEEAGLQY